MGMLTNTGENIQYLASVRFGILHSVRRDQGQAKFRSEINQCAIDPIFAAQKMPLNFDIHVFATKGVDELLENYCAVIPSAVEGSRHVTFKIPQRDPSTALGMTCATR